MPPKLVFKIPAEAVGPRQIAPCGMDCGLCHAYLRPKDTCPGCNAEDNGKSISCLRCRIKNCETRLAQGYRFCGMCASYPCGLIRHIDRRYRARYVMSMTANLERIRREGLRIFVRAERSRWTCPGCGGVACVHKPVCIYCGYDWRKDIRVDVQEIH